MTNYENFIDILFQEVYTQDIHFIIIQRNSESIRVLCCTLFFYPILSYNSQNGYEEGW